MEIEIRGKKILMDDSVYLMIMDIGAKIRLSSKKSPYPVVVFGYKKQKLFYQPLHRFVMGCPEGVTVDHINRNILDARICNLRYATQAQQCQNRRKITGTTSKYKGVSRFKTYWASRIMYKGKQYFLGCFKEESEAAKAYNEKAKEFFGEFAVLNNLEHENS